MTLNSTNSALLSQIPNSPNGPNSTTNSQEGGLAPARRPPIIIPTMSQKWSNKNLPGALHFVTGNVLDRRPIFRQEGNCRAFMHELQDLRKSLECKLIAFVIMLDHFHLILNPRDGDIRSKTGIMKSLSAKRIVSLYPSGTFETVDGNQVWQESFKSLALWSEWMIRQKTNYIHANPVRAGLVNTAADYRWSSFHAFYSNDVEEILRVDKEWWWPEDVDKLRRAMGN
jgi:putative transposase